MEETRPTGDARRMATLALALVVVAGAAVALQLIGLGRTPFHTRGEPREAVVVQDIAAHGDWVLPRRNATALPRKPPLFYWLGGAAAQVRGVVDEATVRLPSALLSTAAALLLTAVVGLTLTPRAGGLSGLFLLTSFEWLRAGTAARVDMTLAFGLTLAFLGLLRLRRDAGTPALVLFYAGVVWATLAKGIPGLAIPAIAIALLCGLDRSLAPLRQLRPLRGLLVVVVLVGAWYAAATAQGGRAFLAIVASENLHRISGGGSFDVGHRHGVGYLVGALAAGLLPWTLLLPAVLLGLWRDRATLTRGDARLTAVLWSLAVFAPHALATSKRGVYLLPLYPAVALLLGWWADRLIAGGVPFALGRRLIGWLAWPLALLLAALALAALAQAAGVPLLDGVSALFSGRTAADVEAVLAALGRHGSEFAALLGIAALALLATAVGAPRGWFRSSLAGLLVATGAVALAVRLVVMPALGAAQTRRPFAAALRAQLADPAALHTVPSLDYGTLFYWGAALPVYDPRDGGDPPRYLLMPEPSWLRAAPALRDAYRRVPGLRVARRTDEGYPVVLERRVEPAPP